MNGILSFSIDAMPLLQNFRTHYKIYTASFPTIFYLILEVIQIPLILQDLLSHTFQLAGMLVQHSGCATELLPVLGPMQS